MTPLSRLILEQYSTRKTRRQKDAFIRLLQSNFPDITVQEGSFPKCRNLIFGDPENARVVLTTHYDTGSIFQFPSIILPKSAFFTLFFDLLRVLPLIGLIIIANLLTGLYTDSYLVHYGISVLLYVSYLLVPLLGPASKNTANRNSSGVITLCELMGTLSDQQLKHVAFVFFDHRETGFLGSSLFHKRFKRVMSDKLVINFDNVTNGDHILVSASKDAQSNYEKLLKTIFLPTDQKSILFADAEKTYYPADHMHFKCSVAVSALEYSRFWGFFQKRNSNANAKWDPYNITMICNCILQLLKKL